MKSENAIPLGDFNKYLSLSWPCAKRAATPRTARTAMAVATIVKAAIRFTAVRVSIFCSRCSCATDSFIGSGMVCSPSQQKLSNSDQRACRTIAIRPEVRGRKQLDVGIDCAFYQLIKKHVTSPKWPHDSERRLTRWLIRSRLSIRRNRYESMGDTIVQLRDAYCSGSMRIERLNLQTADAHCRLYSTGFHD